MNKRTLHRPLALLLTLALTLTLTSVPALAVEGDGATVPDNKATSVWVGGETLSASKTQNKAKTATFDPDTGTLTLNNYQGRGISVRTGSLNIVVQGENRVNETDGTGIYCAKDLTIVGKDATTEDTAAAQSLTAGNTAQRSTASLTIHASSDALSTYSGSLTVRNLATLNCSSTTTVNPIIHAMFGQQGMMFSNIGTMLVRGNTSFDGAISSSNPINFNHIDTLEVLNDNGNAIASYGGLTIDQDCGTVLALSKGKNGIYTYGHDVTIQAKRLIAIGKEYGVWAYYGGKTIDLSGVSSMLLYGETAAMYKNWATINLPNGVDTTDPKKAILAPGGLTQTTITLSGATKTYDGKPATLTPSATDIGSDQMTYIYSWYEEDGTTPLMEAPTDVGTYQVRVYGFSEHYYSDFNHPTTAEVKITPANVPENYSQSFEGTIGNGYNIYTLPEIPEGMKYGTPVVTGTTTTTTTDTQATEQITASIGNGKLSIQAEHLSHTSYSVDIPVTPGANKNYNEYHISGTLTTRINSLPQFDFCDGSAIVTGSTSVPTQHTNWPNDTETANEFGYTIEGWYTAPNGWGEQIANANGQLLAQKYFAGGTTYFAHWVATRAVARYYTIEKPGGEVDSKLVYVHFTGNGKTVYTTGLDFTQATALGDRTEGNGYKWTSATEGTGGTLELSGVLINSGKSSPALTLPAGTKIVLEPDTTLTNAINQMVYYDENDKLLNGTSEAIGNTAEAYNNVCGGDDDVYSLDAGTLTISSESDGCALSVRGGTASVMGNLTLEDQALMSTQGLDVMGDVNFAENSMLATVYPDQVQSRALDLLVSGNLTGSGMLLVDGNITANRIELTNNAMLMSWGALQADTITLSQLAPNSFCDSLQSQGSITLNNATLDLDGKVEGRAASVYAGESLTVENGSELSISDYQMCGIIANQMTVRNSTVDVESKSGAKGALQLLDANGSNADLRLERAKMMKPSGVTLTDYKIGDSDRGLIATVDGETAQTLLIQPYNHSSSSSSSNYAVNIAATKNGTVTPSAARVGSGSTVTLTVEPDGGYVLDSITAKDAAGKDVSLTKTADGKYTFKMPSSAVTVNASFRLRFTDVDPNAWYFDGVQDSVKKGLMEGMSETIFAPNGTLTRAQLVTILWRMEQQPGVNYALPFTDVTEGQWYTEAVRWAASTNVVNGTSATTFTPDAPVTREQLVTMLWRYAKQKGYDVSIGEETNILSYADATTVSEYAIPAMQWVCGAGIIQGADGKLLPKDSTTRAQIATIFQRFGALKA